MIVKGKKNAIITNIIVFSIKIPITCKNEKSKNGKLINKAVLVNLLIFKKLNPNSKNIIPIMKNGIIDGVNFIKSPTCNIGLVECRR